MSVESPRLTRLDSTRLESIQWKNNFDKQLPLSDDYYYELPLTTTPPVSAQHWEHLGSVWGAPGSVR